MSEKASNPISEIEMKKTNVILIALSLSTALASCVPIIDIDNPEHKPGKATPYDPATVADLKCPLLTQELLDEKGNLLEKDTCWSVAPSGINIQTDLVIEEGVVVEFFEDASLTVSSGSLDVRGSAEKPVLFTGKEKIPGFWTGITIQSNEIKNQLKHLVIENCGSDEGPALYLASGRVEVRDSIFKDNANAAFYFSLPDSGLVFENNIIKNNGSPGASHPNLLGKIRNNTYENNADPSIKTAGKVLDPQQWKVNTSINLDGSLTIEGDLQIAEGMTFWMDADVSINVNGTLNAVGTKEKRITFKGTEDLRGYWKGIGIASKSTKNVLKFVSIENAGTLRCHITYYDAHAALCARVDSKVEISNTRVRKSKNNGIYALGDLTGFANNKFVDNRQPMRIHSNQLKNLVGNSTYEMNDDEVIAVVPGGTETNATWKRNAIPFLFSATTVVDSDIKIEAGSEFIFTQNAKLNVSGGSLNAEGTSDQPIVFRGEEDLQGFWSGILIETKSTQNVWDHVKVTGAGSSGWNRLSSHEPTAILIHQGLLNIKNSKIENSGGYGIWLYDGVLNCDANITFKDNKKADVLLKQDSGGTITVSGKSCKKA